MERSLVVVPVRISQMSFNPKSETFDIDHSEVRWKKTTISVITGKLGGSTYAYLKHIINSYLWYRGKSDSRTRRSIGIQWCMIYFFSSNESILVAANLQSRSQTSPLSGSAF